MNTFYHPCMLSENFGKKMDWPFTILEYNSVYYCFSRLLDNTYNLRSHIVALNEVSTNVSHLLLHTIHNYMYYHVSCTFEK